MQPNQGITLVENKPPLICVATMDLSRNDDRPNPARYAVRIRPLGHSALRLSPEFLGSEPWTWGFAKFAQPSAGPKGSALCAAAKLVSDPNNSPPLCRYAERPSNLILPTELVCDLRKPPTLLAEGGAVGGVAK